MGIENYTAEEFSKAAEHSEVSLIDANYFF